MPRREWRRVRPDGEPRSLAIVPLVKIPLPHARSRAGRARATMRIAAGQSADSVTPRAARNTPGAITLFAKPVRPAAADHASTASP